MTMDDLRYDCALAAALLCVETFDTSPGAPKHELIGTIVVVILEAMKRFEAETRRETR
jgi:hypothetical protein